ncbi:CHAT domain-containing protein [Pendulispora brunnea]|uniref:CHAT domain-containing protein n=1 Tax=Pendulispora brunnea TaxID=2905690 RepID=A0ABZ2K6N4_9BACT
MAIMDEVRDAPSPNALLELLVRERSLRHDAALNDLAEKLARDAAQESDSPLGDYRSQQAGFVAELRDTIEETLRADSLALLVAVYEGRQVLFTESFWPLMRALASDASTAGDARREHAFARVLAVYDTLVRALDQISTLRDQSPDELSVSLRPGTIYSDPAFHKWLSVRCRAAACAGSELAPRIAQLREWLVTLCRVTESRANVSGASDGRFSLYASGDMAEAWLIMRPDLHAPFDALLSRVSAGELTVEQAVAAAIADFARDEDSAPFYGAYFLERALRWSGGALLTPALDEYRVLCDRPGEAAIRATTTLRYGTALVLYWRPAGQGQVALEDAEARLASARGTVSPKTSPRLVRDLHFARARLLENVAIWTPDRLAEARAEFEAGLSVERVAHEREPRGRALGGLANVLVALARRGIHVSLERIASLYDEALTLLPNEDSINRAIVLNNYAVFLIEARDTDRATDFERALTYVDEGLAIAIPIRRDPVWVTDAIASLYLTRGNILRHRAYGDLEGRLRAARESFSAGTRFASATSELGGLLRLNQAFLNEELGRLTGDPTFEEEGYRCLVEAQECLGGHPLLSLIVSFAQASFARARPTPEAVSSARDALKSLRERGDLHELAGRAHQFGNLLRRADELPQREEGTALLNEAHRLYGQLALRTEELTAARDLAEALIDDSPPGDPQPNLARAEALLEEASVHADEAWGQVPTIEWRLSSVAASKVHADLAWLRVRRGAPIAEFVRNVCLAKNRELLEHTRLLAGQLTGARLAEARAAQSAALREEQVRWRTQNAASATESTFSEAARAAETIVRARALQAIHAGRPERFEAAQIEAQLASFFSANPESTVIDVTLGSLGTVLVVATATGVSVHALDLRSIETNQARDDWWRAWSRWREASAPDKHHRYAEWNASTEALLALVSERLLGASLSASMIDGRDLVVIAGRLSGIPFHAARVGGTRLLLRARSVAYATSLARLPGREIRWRAPRSALCVLSDPTTSGQASLDASPGELLRVAQRLSQGGTDVTVLASVGDRVGMGALPPHAFADTIRVDGRRPTPSVMAELIPLTDTLVYSGHGSASGLLLMTDEGRGVEWSVEDVLGMDLSARRPFVHLSACSTASEAVAPASEMFSFASWLLRAGAREVLAGAWEVRDDLSALYTDAFLDGLRENADLRLLASEATRRLRLRVGDADLASWAPFQLIFAA